MPPDSLGGFGVAEVGGVIESAVVLDRISCCPNGGVTGRGREGTVIDCCRWVAAKS